MYGLRFAFRTIAFFIGDGMMTGMGAGALIGGLLLPIGGILYGVAIGLMVGILIGLIIGIAVNIANRYMLHPDTDLTTYRRNLSRTVGFNVGALLTVLSLMAIIGSLSGSRYEYPRGLLVIGLGSLFVAIVLIIPAAVCIAAGVSRYADRMVAPQLIKKNEDILAMRLLERPRSESVFIRIMFRKSGWFIAAMVIGIVVLILAGYLIFRGRFSDVLMVAAAAGIPFVLVGITIIILFNSALLKLVNRLYFDEYGTHLTLAQYKYRLGILLGVTTLIYGLIITAVVFAPVAAIIAALSAREYADWHYGSEDKLKRDFAGKSKTFAEG